MWSQGVNSRPIHMCWVFFLCFCLPPCNKFSSHHWSILMLAIGSHCVHWIQHSSTNCITAHDIELDMALWEVNKAAVNKLRVYKDKQNKQDLWIGHGVFCHHHFINSIYFVSISVIMWSLFIVSGALTHRILWSVLE